MRLWKDSCGKSMLNETSIPVLSDPHPDAALAPALDREVDDRRRLKVLVIIPTLWVGGQETSLVRTLLLIDRTRFDITVCTYHDRGALAQQLIDAGIHIIGPYPDSSGRMFSLAHNAGRRLNRWLARWNKIGRAEAWLKWPIQTFASAAVLVIRKSSRVETIAQYIRANKIDVVHATQEYSYIYGALANHLAGRKPLIFSRGSLRAHERSSLLGLLKRHVLHPHVNVAICNSETIAQELQAEGIPRSKIRVIYNGLNITTHSQTLMDRGRARQQLGIAQHNLVFSSVATLRKLKGHADLLHALHKVSKALPQPWLVLIVGRDVDGYLGQLEELCRRLDLASHVRFLGERMDIPIILSAADIHVSASHTEGFPNNILEAMCSRLPVVATKVGGVPELVVDGVTGLLVKSQDPHALSVALLALAKDSERRARMGSAGYHTAKANFSIQRRVAALEEIYQKAVGLGANK
jgi:glycosyltransferase involved in cell wall biosynthesis